MHTSLNKKTRTAAEQSVYRSKTSQIIYTASVLVSAKIPHLIFSNGKSSKILSTQSDLQTSSKSKCDGFLFARLPLVKTLLFQ